MYFLSFFVFSDRFLLLDRFRVWRFFFPERCSVLVLWIVLLHVSMKSCLSTYISKGQLTSRPRFWRESNPETPGCKSSIRAEWRRFRCVQVFPLSTLNITSFSCSLQSFRFVRYLCTGYSRLFSLGDSLCSLMCFWSRSSLSFIPLSVSVSFIGISPEVS